MYDWVGLTDEAPTIIVGRYILFMGFEIVGLLWGGNVQKVRKGMFGKS